MLASPGPNRNSCGPWAQDQIETVVFTVQSSVSGVWCWAVFSSQSDSTVSTVHYCRRGMSECHTHVPMYLRRCAQVKFIFDQDRANASNHCYAQVVSYHCFPRPSPWSSFEQAGLAAVGTAHTSVSSQVLNLMILMREEQRVDLHVASEHL